MMIDKLGYFLDSIDALLNSARKRHLFGGLLMSMAFLCGSMAITVITTKDEKYEQFDI